MENNKTPEMEDIEGNFEGLTKELKEKKADLIKELNTTVDREVSTEPDKKMSEFIGDIFYKSLQVFFLDYVGLLVLLGFISLYRKNKKLLGKLSMELLN